MTAIEVVSVDMFVRDVSTRMTFHLGSNISMDSFELVYMRVEIKSEAGTAFGVSASLLSPMWFDKDPNKSLEEKRAALMHALSLGRDSILSAGRGTIAELHDHASAHIKTHASSAGMNPLTASFGLAIVDLAIVDALCRATQMSFHSALRTDALGLGAEMMAAVPALPLDQVAVRHTIGATDPLTTGDVDVPLGDGLPETLEEVVTEYGIRYFGVKISRDSDAMIQRLAAIAELLSGKSQDWRITLDANEDFTSMVEFADFVERMAAEPKLNELWPRTLILEQPVAREAALDDAVRTPLERIVALGGTVIIDESDGTDDSFTRAWSLGYSGVSSKSCKGVLRSIQHLAQVQRWSTPGRPAVLSAEDLTCPPGPSLEHDLAIAGALGLSNSQKNSYHYIRGLDFLPVSERNDRLAAFPNLYRGLGNEGATLAIRDGNLDLRDVNMRAFGGAEEPEWSTMRPLELPDSGIASAGVG